MPKIIEGVREKILETAKEMLFTEEYQKLSIRSIAKACGIATGTFYNYFENKEVLIANIMVQDWRIALGKMEIAVANASCVLEGMDGIHKAITDFVHIYEGVWSQSASAGTSAWTLERHQFLSQQISQHVEQLLCNKGYEAKKHFSLILAENVLSASTRTYLLTQFRELVAELFPPQGGDNE